MGYGTKMEPLLALGIAAVWGIYGGIYFMQLQQDRRAGRRWSQRAAAMAANVVSAAQLASTMRAGPAWPGPFFACDACFVLAQNSMLDLEFAQLSDPGRVRGHNEDYLGPRRAGDAGAGAHARLALRAGRRRRRAGRGRGRLARRRSKACSPAFAPRPQAKRLAALLPRLVQAANLHVYETGRAASPGGVAHGHHPRGLRAALRSRGGGARRRFALLSDPATASATLLTRDHTVVNEQVRLGLLSAQGSRRVADTATCSAARSATICSSTSTSSEHQVLAGRRAAALLRRPARLRDRRRKWRR